MGDLSQLAGQFRSEERQATLKAWRGKGLRLPLGFAADALMLDLPLAERQLLLELADSSGGETYEAFLLDGLRDWDQDLALAGLSAWVKKTARALAPRLVALPPNVLVPESVLAFLADNAFECGGRALLVSLLGRVASLDELGSATQAVLLRRLNQWCVDDDRVLQHCERVLLRTVETPVPRSTATIFAAEYVARRRPQTLLDLATNPTHPKLFGDQLVALFQGVAGLDRTTAALAKLLKDEPAAPAEFFQRFYELWPPVWLRQKLPAKLLADALAALLARPQVDDVGVPFARAVGWDLFGGADPDALGEAVKALAKKKVAGVEALLGSLLGGEAARAAPAAAAGTVLSEIPSETAARKAFFDRAYRGLTPQPQNNASPWVRLLAGYEAPANLDARELTVAGRATPTLFKQAFLRVAERYGGADELLPALYDLVNTGEQYEALALARALVGVGTRRTLEQAVKLLGRQSVTSETKAEICQVLSVVDLAAHQAELREIIAMLQRDPTRRSARDMDALDAMRTLLTAAEPAAPAAAAATPGGADIDAEVRQRVGAYDKIPRESQRALRTARLIFHTISGPGRREGIDISPSVDLQYKAIEILFRQRWQDEIVRVIQSPSALLQRKLDLVGYGRPGRGKVEAFETYLASLPIVADIPQFSRFKLNRILLAIATHRPGKRFVLDGIKAYAIFLLAFGRSKCDYGLERLFPTAFAGDKELSEFCRDLHIYQEIRNQAVHEGLSAEMHRDVEAFWHLTASVIDRALTALTPS